MTTTLRRPTRSPARVGTGMAVTSMICVQLAAPSTFGSLTWPVVAWGLGLAIVLPTIPFILELLALRRLTTETFGTLMSLEPAIALLVGLVLLGQHPTLLPVIGIGLVIAAGIGAERHGARLDHDLDLFDRVQDEADPRRRQGG